MRRPKSGGTGRVRASLHRVDTRAEERSPSADGDVDPSEHPDWRDAREYGIDMHLLEANLRMTVEQRIEQLEAMDRLWCDMHGCAWGSAWDGT